MNAGNFQRLRTVAVSAVLGLLFAALLLAALKPAQAQENPAPEQAYYLLVYNNPAEGREAEYNRFYDQEHAPGIVANDGFVSGQRFVAAGEGLGPNQSPPRKYLVMYRIRTRDLAATYNAMKLFGA